METSYNPAGINIINTNGILNEGKNVVDKILSLLDKDEVLEKQKLEGTIDDTEYAKEKKEVWDELNQANTQYKELAKISDLPEDLQKRRDNLDPIIIDYASNNGISTGNQNEENKKEVRQVYTDVAAFIKNNCKDFEDGKIVLQELEEYKIYATPAGKALVLKGVTNLNLESIYPNKDYPDLKVPKGALVAFTKGIYSFKAKYKKESNQWKFIGYYSEGGIEYLDTDTENFRQKLDADGKSMANVPFVLATGASKELSKSILKSIGFSEAAIAGEGILSFRNTGIAILGYIIIETFTSPTIITNIEHAEVLDLPETTPINVSGETDNYVKDIPVDLPVTIPHAIPKEDTGGTCKVYVIWKVAKNGNVSIAKYGMTCTDNYDENCNMRPEKQCGKFGKENNPDNYTFFYNWVIRGLTKDMCHVVEKSLTAEYVMLNKGFLPSHHHLPCFVRDKDWDEDLEGKPVERERITRALKWVKDKISQYGTK